MAKLSLLDMTQSILSAMDSDDVNSIDDTVESIQVADLVKEAYFFLMSQRDWPFLRQLTFLEGLGETSNPTRMRMPENISKVFWIKYNKKEIEWVEPSDFHTMISERVEQATVINSDGFIINADPKYWTSYDDKYVVFDGYESTVDNSLQQSKAVVYGTTIPVWNHIDNFVPDLPEKFFPTLLSEAKAQAFVNLKQQSNVREEGKAKLGRTTMRSESWRNEMGEIKYNGKVNYGR